MGSSLTGCPTASWPDKRTITHCGLVIPFPGLLTLQPYLYSMTHISIPYITITLHLFQALMAQHHTDLPHLQASDLTVMLVILAVLPTGAHRAVTIHPLTAAGSLPVAAAVAFHPVAVAVVVTQAVVTAFPPVVAAVLLAVVHPVAAVVLPAVAVVHLVVVAVPQALLPDLLLPPVFLLPLNHSP